MIISFAHTTPALLAGAKNVTRRDWKPQHAAHFHDEDLIDAWDWSPRTGKGHPIAQIRLTQDPRLEWSDGVDSVEYEREGFAWMNAHGQGDVAEAILHDWRSRPRQLYVVRFEVVSLMCQRCTPSLYPMPEEVRARLRCFLHQSIEERERESGAAFMADREDVR